MSSLACVMMLAPVKQTIPAISMEYQRALMETKITVKASWSTEQFNLANVN